nr:MAG TPA: hypothetical protein [Bacteriophage sp.]
MKYTFLHFLNSNARRRKKGNVKLPLFYFIYPILELFFDYLQSFVICPI